MDKLVISLEHIKKTYGDKVVLEDINLKITNDSFISILGKSGAGKSTLMNIVGLIEHFDGGTYRFNDKVLKRKKDYAMLRLSEIGFVFQSYNLIPTLTCRENIELPMIYSSASISQDVYMELAEELGISDLLDKPINILSGGEKQRIAIVRALVMNPKLIIADEPTGNLDDENKFLVFDMLKREYRRGRAVLIITHDSSLAKKTSQTYILREGRLYEC